MAAGTAALIAGGVGLLSNGAKIFEGKNRMRDAQNELNGYERQELNNAFKNVQISTSGSDLIKEESARTTASLIDSVSNSGVRGVLGGIPKIQQYNNNANQEARSYIDNQIQKRDYAIAEDEARIRGIKENRDNSNISALSSQVEAGRQDMWNGIEGVAQSGISLANSAFKNSGESTSTSNKTKESVGQSNITSYDTVPYKNTIPYFGGLPKLSDNKDNPNLFDDYENYNKNNRRKLF